MTTAVPNPPKTFGALSGMPATPNRHDLVKKIVTVETVKVVNENWAIAFGKDESSQEVKLTGPEVPTLSADSVYEVHGRLRSHPKHGESIEVVSAVPHILLERQSIIKFMRKSFKNVGLKTAMTLIDLRVAACDGNELLALEGLRNELINNPWAISWEGVTGRDVEFKLDEDSDQVEAFIQRDFATRVGANTGMTTPVLKALVRWARMHAAVLAAEGNRAELAPTEQAWAAYADDPYFPISEVRGYGWKLANVIGHALSIPFDDVRRIRALVAEAVNLASAQGGHMFVLRDEVKAAIGKLDARVDVDQALMQALQDDVLCIDEVDGVERVYSKTSFATEVGLAKEIMRLSVPVRPFVDGSRLKNLDAWLQGIFQRIHPGQSLDDGQLKALRGLLAGTQRIQTLTGGPGCGKTSIMEVFVEAVHEVNGSCELSFAAPTGIAAKILGSRVGARRPLSASTIHSMLEGDEGGFRRNGTNPLVTDCLGVDEMSMCDSAITLAWLKALPDNARAVLIGDPNQLQSIGPGRVLADFMAMPSVGQNRLRVTHRNAGHLLQLINQVNQGVIDFAQFEGSKQVEFSHGLTDDHFDVVIDNYLSAIQQYGIERVGLLMSRRQGMADTPGWNTDYFNARLRRLVNPAGEKIPGMSMYVGDRIIIKDNLHLNQRPAEAAKDQWADPFGSTEEDGPKVRVVNGDTGTILSYSMPPQKKTKDNKPQPIGAQWLRLRLDDGRDIDMNVTFADSLQWSYARTIHASQGGQFDKVISVITPGHPSFVNRSSMFTAMSRTKVHLSVFGEDKVIAQVAATPPPERNSALVERVVALQGSDVDEDDMAPCIPQHH